MTVICCCKQDIQKIADGICSLMEVQVKIKWTEIIIFVSLWNGFFFLKLCCCIAKELCYIVTSKGFPAWWFQLRDGEGNVMYLGSGLCSWACWAQLILALGGGCVLLLLALLGTWAFLVSVALIPASFTMVSMYTGERGNSRWSLLSADEDVDDSFTSIGVKNIGIKRYELGEISQESNLGLWRLSCYPVYVPIMLFFGLLAFELLILLSIENKHCDRKATKKGFVLTVFEPVWLFEGHLDGLCWANFSNGDFEYNFPVKVHCSYPSLYLLVSFFWVLSSLIMLLP